MINLSKLLSAVLQIPLLRSCSHLIAEELVQVSQLFGVGDLALQSIAALSCGPADLNGRVSTDPLIVLVGSVVALWSVVSQGDCRRTRETLHYLSSNSKFKHFIYR